MHSLARRPLRGPFLFVVCILESHKRKDKTVLLYNQQSKAPMKGTAMITKTIITTTAFNTILDKEVERDYVYVNGQLEDHAMDRIVTIAKCTFETAMEKAVEMTEMFYGNCTGVRAH